MVRLGSVAACRPSTFPKKRPARYRSHRTVTAAAVLVCLTARPELRSRGSGLVAVRGGVHLRSLHFVLCFFFFSRRYRPLVFDLFCFVVFFCFSTAEVDLWTRTASGCACPWNAKRKTCACCAQGGCLCGERVPSRCGQCGLQHQCDTSQWPFYFFLFFFLRSLFDRNRFPRPVGRLVSTGPVLQRHWLSATNENASTEVSLRLRDRVDAPPLPGPHQRTKRVPPSLTRPCLRLVRAVEASSCRITSSLNDANLIGSQPPIGRCQAGTNPWAPNEERTATASRDRRRPVKRNEKERKRAGVGRSFRASYTPVLFFLRSLPDRGNRYASPFFFFCLTEIITSCCPRWRADR